MTISCTLGALLARCVGWPSIGPAPGRPGRGPSVSGSLPGHREIGDAHSPGHREGDPGDSGRDADHAARDDRPQIGELHLVERSQVALRVLAFALIGGRVEAPATLIADTDLRLREPVERGLADHSALHATASTSTASQNGPSTRS